MKKKFLGLCIFLISCNNSNAPQSKIDIDPMHGEWIYEDPMGGGFEIRITSPSNIEIREYSIIFGAATSGGYYRKSVGTFTKNEESVRITYTYGTCLSSGSEETINLSMSDRERDKLNLRSRSGSLTFFRKQRGPYFVASYMHEDLSCSMVKLQKESSRLPTSKASGAFERINQRQTKPTL